jgi:hypothetical protein
VATTLNLSSKGVNMTHWCLDIQEQLRAKIKAAYPGESDEFYDDMLENVNAQNDPAHFADSIEYDTADIQHTWLQQMAGSGLYVLVAPIVHEDSMNIEVSDLQIMLRNLVQNGGFDFVVCDTGNNTRSSSIIALQITNTIMTRDVP